MRGPDARSSLQRLSGRAREVFVRRPEFAILSLIVIVGFIIRIWELESVQTPWFDEITSYYVPFLIIHGYGGAAQWGLLRGVPPTPVSATYILAYSTVTGMAFPALIQTSSAFVIRIPAVISGTVLLVFLYGLGSELFSKRVGLVAATLGAVVPWTFYWSRFAGIIAPLELWPVVSIYLALVAIRQRNRHVLLLSLLLGGLTVYTQESGIAAFFLLILPFWLISARSFVSSRGPSSIPLSTIEAARFWAPYIACLVVVLLPIAVFELQPVAPTQSVLGSSQLIWRRCGGFSCTASSFLSNALLSWSPDFLAISGGLNGAQSAGFQPHVSIGGVWQAGGGFTGMLTILGLLVYPALMLLLARRTLRGNRGSVPAAWLATFLLIAYTAVGGLVYYDNPNSARLAFAAGPFIVLIAWLLVELVDWVVSVVWSRIAKRRTSTPRRWRPSSPSPASRSLAVALGVALVVAPVSVVYLSDYFDKFPAIADTYFYSQIKAAAGELSAANLWGFSIVLLCPSDLLFILPTEIAFYDPNKPPPAPISVFNGTISNNLAILTSSPRGIVFVSLVPINLSILQHTGLPAEVVYQSPTDSVFWIAGEPSPLASPIGVTPWVQETVQTTLAAAADFSSSHLSPGDAVGESVGSNYAATARNS